jgi:hypothetical protein
LLYGSVMTTTRLDRVIMNQRKLLVFNAAATLGFMGMLCASIVALF